MVLQNGTIGKYLKAIMVLILVLLLVSPWKAGAFLFLHHEKRLVTRSSLADGVDGVGGWVGGRG